MVFILSAFWWIRVRGLEASWWKELAVGESGFYSRGQGTLSKSLPQFVVNGRGCFPCLLFSLRPNYGRGNGSDCGLLLKDLCQHLCSQCPWLRGRPLPTHSSAADSRTLTGKSGSVSFGVTAPFSWVLVHIRAFWCHPRTCFPSFVEVL